MRRFPGPLSKLFVASCLAACCGVVGYSQGSRAPNSVERRIETMNRQAKDFERDNMGRDARTKVDAESAKRTRQIRMEIEQDLKTLQKIYNDTVIALQSSEGMPPGYAAETGRAVRNLAVRLRSNLILPALDQEESRTGPPPLPDTDRKTLSALCKVIYAFITNPIFDGAGAMDVKNGTNASTELGAIIRLAEHLSVVPETETE